MYFHGGFEHTQSSLPVNSLIVIDLKEMLEPHPELVCQVKDYARISENQTFILADNVTLGIFKDNQIFTKTILTDELNAESVKLKNHNKYLQTV